MSADLCRSADEHTMDIKTLTGRVLMSGKKDKFGRTAKFRARIAQRAIDRETAPAREQMAVERRKAIMSMAAAMAIGQFVAESVQDDLADLAERVSA